MTGMEMANASLLDEGTAAAEAMALAKRASKHKSNTFFIADDIHPQTYDVVVTRAKYFGFEIITGSIDEFPEQEIFGALIQYPGSSGSVADIAPFIAQAHEGKALVAVATDLLSLAMLKPPGEMDADIVVGSAQRFGVPMGFGGPHAAFFATRDAYKRSAPGRIIGVSKDQNGKTALRMAMQTREQHIRRDKATSNICTAQALLANMAAFYAIYHGAGGIRTIARRVHQMASTFADGIRAVGLSVAHDHFFDTVIVSVDDADAVHQRAVASKVNLRRIDSNNIGVSVDETTTTGDVQQLLDIFAGKETAAIFDTCLL